MPVWGVKAGWRGEHENLVFEKGLIVFDWDQVPDLEGIDSKDVLRKILEDANPGSPVQRIAYLLGELLALTQMRKGDLVVMRYGSQASLAFGEITGAYSYRPDLPKGARHTYPVKWLREDVPRGELGRDLLANLSTPRMICRLYKNSAEERIREIFKGKPDPGTTILDDKASFEDETERASGQELINIEEYSQDQIRSFIGENFREHRMTYLVSAILRAQGYQTYDSPPGPDGGVDILAGKGAMGFDHPKLCVQVKSGSDPIDIMAIRELEGVMSRINAEHGLFVSWSGFKRSVNKEKRHLFFKVRLWDSSDLIEALLKNYENLSDAIQAEIPLKRVWTLVTDLNEA